MCSTARVVSSPSCSGPTDPRRGSALGEENFISPRPNTRTPQEALASDLDWDEDELAISAYPSYQHIVHTYNQNDDEVQATVSRIHPHMSVDECTPLLPSMTDAAPRPTSPHHPQNSIPIKSTIVGQSTFHQTVSHRVFFVSPESIAFSAFDASTSFSMLPHYCLVSACFRSLLRSPMQGGSVEHYSLSPMATSRATRMFLSLTLPPRPRVLTSFHSKGKIFGGHRRL
jgi:hypothetical protein